MCRCLHTHTTKRVWAEFWMRVREYKLNATQKAEASPSPHVRCNSSTLSGDASETAELVL